MTAPGKHFRKEISLLELFKLFPDSETAEKWIIERRWGKEPSCPHCGSKNVQTGAKHKTMPFRCRESSCGRRFSVRIGTVMESSNLNYQVWAIAMYLMAVSIKGISSMKLHRDLSITQKSAWHLAHRLRKSLEVEGMKEFVGPVEVDETYIGGKERNKRASKKLRAGRGTVGKVAVVGMKDRATNKIRAEVVKNTDAKTLQAFVIKKVRKDTQVFTDDARAYIGLPVPHKAVKHSVGEYVDGMAHTNGIESFWAMLKRGYHGTYHKMSKEHLFRYVSEFATRHNIRDEDTLTQMNYLVEKMDGKRLKYADLTVACRED